VLGQAGLGIIASISPSSAPHPPERSPPSEPSIPIEHAAPRVLARIAERWTGRENPERVVYGVILIGALLAAESGLHDSYPATVGSVAIGLGVYWLAHSYAAVLGRRLSERGRLSLRALVQALAREWAIVRGALIPVLALLVCWAAGASQTTGIAVAIWSAIVALVALELLAGVAAGASTGELFLEGAIGAVLGLAILALKALAH
jgi:hypothetical protein